MSDFDLLIRGGTVVTHASVARLDIGIANERIVALEPELKPEAW